MSRIAFAAGLLILTIPPALITWIVYSERAKPTDCLTTKQTADISQRAAQICTAELVGCSLSHEQIKQILAEQEAAKACR